MQYLKLSLRLFITTMVSVHLQLAALAQTSKTISADAVDTTRPIDTLFCTAQEVINGQKIKLVLIGDLVPELTINGTQIPLDELTEHQDVVDRLSKVIRERQKNEAARKAAIIEKTKMQILNEITSKGYIADEVKSYYLTTHQLLVNNIPQAPDVFEYFKNKYIRSADVAYYFEKYPLLKK
ncbi:MAG TPA: hypothetical protein VFZ42_14480 [Chitinophagaceae bacterium]